MAAVRAVRSMIAAGADAGVMAVARDFVKRTKVLAVASFDNLVHEALGGDRDTGEPERKSVATALVDLAQEFYTFGVSDLGEPFAIPIDGPRVVAMLRGSKTSLRALLAREYFSRTGKAATQQALADALLVIEGMAQEQGESRLYMRAAQHDGALWLDLGDSTGRAVRITSAGWAVEDQVPVLFKRTSLTGPLPEPQRGGDLSRSVGVAQRQRGRPATCRRRTGRPAVQRDATRGAGHLRRARHREDHRDQGPRSPPRPRPGPGAQAAQGRRVVGDRGVRVVGGGAGQPLRHPPVAVRLAVPRLNRRRRRAPQALHRRRLRGVRVPAVRHLRLHRRRRSGARPRATAPCRSPWT